MKQSNSISGTHAAAWIAFTLATLILPSIVRANEPPPNFVVVLTDDQSWVGTSVLIDPENPNSSSDYYATPNIARLFDAGMRFTRGYAPAPFCCPTRRSLLVGQTPARHIYQQDQRNWTARYREQLSLPQMLKRADERYRTAHFGKWDMRFDDVTPEQMGYDVSDGYTDNGSGGGKGAGGPAAKRDPKQIFGITERACSFMQQQASLGNPFFLQVSHYAVHLDIFYRESTLQETRKRVPGKKHTMPEFAAMTSDVDAGIGILLDKIRALEIDKSTYVFFLSDNGGRNTMPGQKGRTQDRNHPLRDGKGSVYEGGIRVPFVIQGPNVASGAVCNVPVTGLDLFPTIAELAGFTDDLPTDIDGGSLTKVMFQAGKGTVDRQRPFLLFHQAVARSPETALLMGDDKLVKTWDTGKLELFDLGDDTGESNDLAQSNPKKVRELHELMTNFLDEVDAETRKTGTKAQVYAAAQPDDATTNANSTSKQTASATSKETAVATSKATRNPERKSPPNVLFLAIDDLNDWIGALGGHPQAKTPNLDRLLAKSTVFTNAHCAAPVCSASRHALLSGLRPSTTGWYTSSSKKRSDYERVLGATTPLPTHFKNHGYKTLAAGKIFHRGTSDIKGYDYWTESRPKYKWPKELIARGHGYQGPSGGHFHPFPPDGGAIYQRYQSGVDGQSLCWGALGPNDMPQEGMPDEQIADWAVQRLQQKHDQPFFLAVGFIRPHVPYTAPARFFDLYPLDEITVPAVPEDEMDDIPLHGKAMALGTIEGGDHANVLAIGPDYWREMTRAYLACVSFVDAQAGKVLDALEASPYADNTLIVFWSDHGQHLGEKRHWRKQALWEESTRVPLAFHLPDSDGKGQVCDAPVGLIDIYPTLLEVCQLPSVPGLEGESLEPQLIDPDARRRTPAVTTWHYNNHSIRGPRWRYIRYRDGSEELYNHKHDPEEHVNQAANAKHADIKARLKKFLPKTNVKPSSLKGGGLDSHGRRVQNLSEQGIPDWLGKDPASMQLDSDSKAVGDAHE